MGYGWVHLQAFDLHIDVYLFFPTVIDARTKRRRYVFVFQLRKQRLSQWTWQINDAVTC